MTRETGKEERRIWEKYGNLLSKEEETLLKASFEIPSRASNDSSAKKLFCTRSRILPRDYLSSQEFSVFLSMFGFVIFYHLFLAGAREPFPPSSVVENLVTYGIFGVGCIALFLRIKLYYKKEKSIFYTKRLIFISASWLFFNMNLYFDRFVGLSLFALLVVPCVWLYFSRKENLALLYLTIISFFCCFAIIGKTWIVLILMGLFGIIRKILKDFDPSKLKLRDVNVYFLLSYLKGHHIIQSVGGVCFLGVYTYASDRLNISFGMQLTFWGVFLWNLMMTAVYFDAVLEYHKEIVFSDVEVH